LTQQTRSDAPRESSKLIYERYITSTKWERRKAAYYANHERRCRACGTKESIHLHHHTYARMGNELDTDLVPLCEEHHMLVHKFHREGRLSLTTATRKFLEYLGASLDTPSPSRPKSKPRPKPRRVPQKPIADRYISLQQAAELLGVTSRDIRKPRAAGCRGDSIRETTINNWASQPPRWLREARERGPRPEFRPAWYSGGGRPYSPEVQALFSRQGR
jgi:hypothetical protein